MKNQKKKQKFKLTMVTNVVGQKNETCIMANREHSSRWKVWSFRQMMGATDAKNVLLQFKVRKFFRG